MQFRTWWTPRDKKKRKRKKRALSFPLLSHSPPPHSCVCKTGYHICLLLPPGGQDELRVDVPVLSCLLIRANHLRGGREVGVSQSDFVAELKKIKLHELIKVIKQMNLMIVPCLYKEKQMRKHTPKPLLIVVRNFCCTSVVGIWIHHLVFTLDLSLWSTLWRSYCSSNTILRIIITLEWK